MSERYVKKTVEELYPGWGHKHWLVVDTQQEPKEGECKYVASTPNEEDADRITLALNGAETPVNGKEISLTFWVKTLEVTVEEKTYEVKARDEETARKLYRAQNNCVCIRGGHSPAREVIIGVEKV